MTNSAKIARSGVVTSVPPGMRFTRAFDQRSHPYQGYILRVRRLARGCAEGYLALRERLGHPLLKQTLNPV